MGSPLRKKGSQSTEPMDFLETEEKVLKALQAMTASLGAKEELSTRQFAVVTALEQGRLPNANHMKLHFLERELEIRSGTRESTWPKLQLAEKIALVQALRAEQDEVELLATKEAAKEAMPTKKKDLIAMAVSMCILDATEAEKKTVGQLKLMIRMGKEPSSAQEALASMSSSSKSRSSR